MIKHHEKFRLLDENHENEFYAEVNWDPKDKTTNECKVIKFVFPDGRQAFVKKELLNAFLFVIGNQEEQRDLIPQRVTRVRNYETVLGIKAQKDISKGEMINVRVKIPINIGEDEIIGQIGAVLKPKGLAIK